MARRSQRRERVHSTPRTLDALLATPVAPSSFVTDFIRPPSSLVQLEDRRTFWPESSMLRPALTLRGTGARIVVKDRPANVRSRRSPLLRYDPFKTQGQLAFAAPERTLVCVRRQRRKEVLHALRKAGRRGSQRRRRRSEFSDISCR